VSESLACLTAAFSLNNDSLAPPATSKLNLRIGVSGLQMPTFV